MRTEASIKNFEALLAAFNKAPKGRQQRALWRMEALKYLFSRFSPKKFSLSHAVYEAEAELKLGIGTLKKWEKRVRFIPMRYWVSVLIPPGKGRDANPTKETMIAKQYCLAYTGLSAPEIVSLIEKETGQKVSSRTVQRTRAWLKTKP